MRGPIIGKGIKGLGTGLLLAGLAQAPAAQAPAAQAPAAQAQDSACPAALSRLVSHTIKAGETLDSIAAQYKLIPATLMGFNPALRAGQAPVGTTIEVPPLNGIRVEVPAGTPIKVAAARYKVRADVLFEVNGCRAVSAGTLFLPGVNWSPVASTGGAQSVLATAYPLPKPSPVLMGFGWKVRGEGEVGLHSGIDLAAATGTAALAAADGTVAFAGVQGSYGNLVVINHAQGYQTRYGQLGSIGVKLGQQVRKGEPIGTTGTSGKPSSSEPHLHFEVRVNSKLGWVAEDPAAFLK
jgi:murein DD-endopeptidase MepM/ murein hydrolase activator NlpD